MKTLLNPTRFTITSLLLFVIVAISSCKGDDPSPYPYVNNWILAQMQEVYYWNTSIPTNVKNTQDPEAYFKALLSTQDRFSWIQPNYKELLNFLKGINKEAGYEIALYKMDATTNKLIAQILYVKPNSSAAAAGLKRGDAFTHINNQQLTTDNYKSLLEETKKNHSIRYRPLIIGADSFGSEKTVSLSAVEYVENPNYLNKVITLNNNRKAGYYVYNFFASGPGERNDKTYDNEMDEIFASFKAQNITDLVLDLRFNSGGSEASANNLASLIGNSVDESKVFLKSQYNTIVTNQIINDSNLGEEFFTRHFFTKANNVGSMLTNNRVYILTSSRTASASELIINALKPYMEVFLIGEVTVGKNVGSISIYEENDPKNTWGIQPIVVKVSNSLGQSDYSNGFAPNIMDEDNSPFIYPLGDVREALLAQAINHISGFSFVTRPHDRKIKDRKLIGHSLDIKRRGFTLVMDRHL